MKKKISNFCELTRMYSLTISLSSFAVAFLWSTGYQISKFNVLLLFIAIAVLHLGGNLFDDIFDIFLKIKNGTKLSDVNFCDDKNKARLIIDGVCSIKKASVICALLFAIALIIGLYFYLIYGKNIVIYSLVTGILILIYPISAKYYLSEIIIAFLFGFLLPRATFFVLTGSSSLNLTHFSLSIVFLMVAILHTHSITDWEHDEKSGKKTLAILCKNKTNAVRLLGWLIFAAYLNLAVLISLYFLPALMIMTFITTPIAVELVLSMKKYIALENTTLQPRWWMGIMENWEDIKKNNLQYFMYRFYLARNLCVYFSIIAAIMYAIAVNY